MIAYASRTGTRRNLDRLRESGWRLLVAPSCARTEGFRYALDNGAWSAFTSGRAFDAKPFEIALGRLGHAADWVVAPDIVAGGVASLDLSLSWLPRVLGWTRTALLAVQDGMVPNDVSGLLGGSVGLFVGGTTEWKLRTMRQWCDLARERSCWVHVGRVNSRRRILACSDAGAMSFDGSSASRYSDTLPLLDWSRRQTTLAVA